MEQAPNSEWDIYQLVNGCKWADLLKDLSPLGKVFYWF